jgi:hypothetical protein
MYEAFITFLTGKPKKRIYVRVEFPEIMDKADYEAVARAYQAILQEAFVEAQHKYRWRIKLKPILRTASIHWVNDDKVPYSAETAVRFLLDIEKSNY